MIVSRLSLSRPNLANEIPDRPKPAALRSGRKKRAASTPLRHAYIGVGALPGHLASQSKVVRASYLLAGRVPAVYLMIPQAPPQQAHGSNGCQLGTATTKPTM